MRKGWPLIPSFHCKPFVRASPYFLQRWHKDNGWIRLIQIRRYIVWSFCIAISSPQKLKMLMLGPVQDCLLVCSVGRAHARPCTPLHIMRHGVTPQMGITKTKGKKSSTGSPLKLQMVRKVRIVLWWGCALQTVPSLANIKLLRIRPRIGVYDLSLKQFTQTRCLRTAVWMPSILEHRARLGLPTSTKHL